MIIQMAVSTIKAYFYLFPQILRHLSLGGRICRTPWIEPLRRCWMALTKTDPLKDPTGSFVPNFLEVSTASCLIYYSFFQSAELPTSKLYIPVRHWCRDDLSIAQAVGGLIQSFSGDNQPATADLYPKLLQECYPKASLGSTKGRQTYLCLGRKDDGSFELST